jgi:hypothetical protein
LRRRIAFLALVTCLCAGLAACSASKLQPAAALAPLPRASGAVPPRASGHDNTKAGCPRGRLLPAGEAEAIDYVDFVHFSGRSYDRAAEPITTSQLGRVVTHVRCSLIAEEDQRHGGPPIIDGTASFLPVGAPVYQILGYPASCRLGAYLKGALHVYLAQSAVHGQAAAAPKRCAVVRRRGLAER